MLLLVEKSRLHALVGRIDDISLRATARFAVMALVVLPLLPEGPYGPMGGVRLRELWSNAMLYPRVLVATAVLNPPCCPMSRRF